MIIDINKVKASTASILFMMLGCISLGFLFLFIYERELFFTLDLFRLSVLTIALTTPIVTANGFLMLLILFVTSEDDISEENYFSQAAFYGGILCMLMMMIPIIFGYISQLPTSWGLYIMGLLQFVAFIFLFITLKKGIKRRKNR